MLWFLAAILAMQGTDEVRVSSHAYVSQSPYTLRVDTKLVEIAATVRDGRGKAVGGLTKDDFRVLDEGKTREIASFSVEKSPSSTSNTPSPKNPPEALEDPVSPVSNRKLTGKCWPTTIWRSFRPESPSNR